MPDGRQILFAREPTACLILLWAAFVLLTANPACGEIYKYRDKNGHIHFTDKPQKRAAGFELLWRSGNDPRYASYYSRINLNDFERNKQRYSDMITKTAERMNLQPNLLHAVVRAESAYDPKALSRKGARGLMQLMPATAERYGVSDSWDPEQNLTGGARYLRDLLDMFDQDMKLAVAAYNAGENAVRKYGNKIPPYPETLQYVQKVVSLYQTGS
ncbi:MAG: lytic transglycosylase domain-containing protein [Gammaproteobacteria bacterium]|nr:lytic transglycosylase domain-containing protein [Gammaproteobacteria bacterium]MCB1851634.1 lytic transglycosylase domain-containing protein [Gammaproteobacteria bacterium]MCP5416404.1 lytic transglycosylase domain-containing protein [Chromatiaceae bacterium]